MTTERNSPGQVLSTARNSPGLQREPPHQPMTKVSYSKKIPRTTARISPPAYEKSFLHPNFYLQKSPKGNLIKVAKILNFVYPWESLPIQHSEEVKPSTKDK